MKTHLKDLIASSFYNLHHKIRRHDYTHYWLKGGRGSVKSSFVSLEIILGMMKNPKANAICLRKYGFYLKDSVHEQLIWAIEALGAKSKWRIGLSLLKLTYIPTGQVILFRGADNPKKSASIKVSKGYFAYGWYEKADEFVCIDEFEIINRSLLRGGEWFWVFYSFNPPKRDTFLADEIEEIVIDQERCPKAAREFVGYELDQDAYGNFKAKYPNKNNHAIDVVSYSVEDDMIGQLFIKPTRRNLW